MPAGLATGVTRLGLAGGIPAGAEAGGLVPAGDAVVLVEVVGAAELAAVLAAVEAAAAVVVGGETSYLKGGIHILVLTESQNCAACVGRFRPIKGT